MFDQDFLYRYLKGVQFLDNLEKPSSLTTLRIKGYAGKWGIDGLGLESIKYVSDFIEEHDMCLQHLSFNINSRLGEDKDCRESLHEILDKLKSCAQNMTLDVSLADVPLESCQRLRLFRLKKLQDSTNNGCFKYGDSGDELISSTPRCLKKYADNCRELASWNWLEELDFSRFDFIDHDVFKVGEDQFYEENFNKLKETNCPKELFGRDDPQLPSYAERKELFEVISQLSVKKLIVRYPHCKIHSLLQDCLQKGLKNLEEIKIVGYNLSIGPMSELISMMASRKNLKYTIECHNSWDESSCSAEFRGVVGESKDNFR